MLIASLVALLAGYQYGGTFIGAVICKDGIVIASDSRTTFMDEGGHAFAYLDGIPKIYVDRGAAVAVSGLTSVDGELFGSFVNRNRFLLERAVNEILFGFAVWLPFKNSNGIGMISAGFLEGSPMICSKSPILPQSCSHSGFIANKNSMSLRNALIERGRPPTAMQAAAALTAAIEEYSRTDPTVGGPTTVVKLTKDAPPQWLTTRLTDSSAATICDLVREYRASLRRITPLATREEMDQHLRAACSR